MTPSPQTRSTTTTLDGAGLKLVAVRLHLRPEDPAWASFEGEDAEYHANATLARVATGIPPGTAFPVHVVSTFAGGFSHTSTHRIRFADTDGSVRDHVLRCLRFIAQSAALRQHVGLSLPEIHRLLEQLPSPHRGAQAVLWDMTAKPPPFLARNRLMMNGYQEFWASLGHALRLDLSPHEAVLDAQYRTLDMAPADPTASDFLHGAEVAQRRSLAALEHDADCRRRSDRP